MSSNVLLLINLTTFSQSGERFNTLVIDSVVDADSKEGPLFLSGLYYLIVGKLNIDLGPMDVEIYYGGKKPSLEI